MKPQPSVSQRKKRKLPPWIAYAVVVLVIGGGWFAWVKTHPSGPDAGAMVTGKVKLGDLIETVTATGSIAAQTGAEVKIGSQITGRIKRLYADVGTVVKAGDLIAQLDLPDVEAQLTQAKATNASAQSKLVQQGQNVTLGQSQTGSAISVARAALESAKQRLLAAQAGSRLQRVQTPADIRRAEAAEKQSVAALSTSKSVLAQQKAGANLQIQTAQESVKQALATDTNNQADLVRQEALLEKGFVAGKVVDQARQLAAVSHSQYLSAQQALQLTQQKVRADLEAASDQVTQAQEAVSAAQAALEAARAGTFLITSKAADVADAAAAVAQAQANLTNAVGNLTSNSVRQQDVQQARELVKQTAAQIAVSQAQVEKTFIRTPISGTVLQLAAQQGETLAAGLSAPTLIIVADLHRLEVDAYVDETDIGKVKIGQPAQITVDAFPDLVMSGRVTKVAAGSTIQQGVVTYGVTINLDDPKGELKPDMTASVTIQTGKRSNVLLIPSVAIQVGVNGSTVNIAVEKDGKKSVRAVPVKTGGSDGVNTEIVSGLEDGQTIVLAGGQPSTRRNNTSSSPFGTSGGGGGGGGRGGPPGG